MLLKMLLWQSILATFHFATNAYPKTSTTKTSLTPSYSGTGNYSTTFVKNKTLNENANHTEIKVFVLNTTTSRKNESRNESDIQMQLRELRRELGKLKTKMARKSMYCDFLPTTICGPCSCINEGRLPSKYYCDCRHLQAEQDCLEFRQKDYKIDGIYKVTGIGYKTVEVFCDQTSDNGGWTVFQRRFDGTESFHRDWEMYKVGFGDLQFEHWLGNEHLHKLMLHALYSKGTELRVDLMDWDRKKKYAQYEHFQVDSEFAKYELHVGGYKGTAGDAFKVHNKLGFTAIDEDNDLWTSGNCAQKYSGGWWYTGVSCVGGASLNHKYYQLGVAVPAWYGIVWTGMNINTRSLKRTEMKFRRKV